MSGLCRHGLTRQLQLMLAALAWRNKHLLDLWTSRDGSPKLRKNTFKALGLHHFQIYPVQVCVLDLLADVVWELCSSVGGMDHERHRVALDHHKFNQRSEMDSPGVVDTSAHPDLSRLQIRT